MRIIKSHQNDVIILTVEGEVNMTTSPELRNYFLELIKTGHSRLVVDFTKMAYLDSSGLATLVECHQNVNEKKGKLSLVNVPEKIKNLFSLTKLDKVFVIFPSIDSAVSSYS